MSVLTQKLYPAARIINYSYNFCQHRSMSTKYLQKGKTLFKLGLAGITMGAIVGTGYSVHSMNKPRTHILNEQTFISSLDKIPKIKPTKQILFADDSSHLKLTLYQYQTCPFCCKVRAFLDYHGISYDVVEVDPVLRQAIKWSPYRKVPILVVQTKDNKYQPLNDSSMIISALATYLKENTKDITEVVKYYPFISFIDENGTKKDEIMNKYFLMFNDSTDIDEKVVSEERKWRKWVDEVLVHTISPNVYRTKEEAFQAFYWFSDIGEWDKNFPEWERQLMIYVGAYAMYYISKRLVKRHGLKEDVRQSLYDECNFWIKSIQAKGTKFMGGSKPNLADLSVFGILNSMEGCNAFQDLLNNSKIKKWFYNMKDELNQHKTIIVP